MSELIARSRFELLSRDPESRMIDRYTTGLNTLFYCHFFLINLTDDGSSGSSIPAFPADPADFFDGPDEFTPSTERFQVIYVTPVIDMGDKRDVGV